MVDYCQWDLRVKPSLSLIRDSPGPADDGRLAMGSRRWPGLRPMRKRASEPPARAGRLRLSRTRTHIERASRGPSVQVLVLVRVLMRVLFTVLLGNCHWSGQVHYADFSRRRRAEYYGE